MAKQHYHKTKFKCANCQKEQSFMVLCGASVLGESGPQCMFCSKRELACLGWENKPEYPIQLPVFIADQGLMS